MQHLTLFAVLLAQLVYAMDKPVDRSGKKGTLILAQNTESDVVLPRQKTISTVEAGNLIISASFTSTATKNKIKLTIRKKEKNHPLKARAEIRKPVSSEEAKVLKKKSKAEDTQQDTAQGSEDDNTDSGVEDNSEDVEESDAGDDSQKSLNSDEKSFESEENSDNLSLEGDEPDLVQGSEDDNTDSGVEDDSEDVEESDAGNDSQESLNSDEKSYESEENSDNLSLEGDEQDLVQGSEDDNTDTGVEDDSEDVEESDAGDDSQELSESEYQLALERKYLNNIMGKEAEESRAGLLLQEYAREAEVRAKCERALEAETLRANIRKGIEELQIAEELARKELELELAREANELQLICAAEALADKMADQQFLEIEARNAQKDAAILAAIYKIEAKEQAAQEDREKLELELEKAREIYSLNCIYAEEALADKIAEQQLLVHEARTALKEATILAVICEKEAKEQAEQEEKAKEEFEAILAEEARAIEEIILNEKAVEEKALRLAIKEAEDEQAKERKALEDIMAKEVEVASFKASEENKQQSRAEAEVLAKIVENEAFDSIIEEELEKAKVELDRIMESRIIYEISRIEADEEALDDANALDKFVAQAKLESHVIESNLLLDAKKERKLIKKAQKSFANEKAKELNILAELTEKESNDKLESDRLADKEAQEEVEAERAALAELIQKEANLLAKELEEERLQLDTERKKELEILAAIYAREAEEVRLADEMAAKEFRHEVEQERKKLAEIMESEAYDKVDLIIEEELEKTNREFDRAMEIQMLHEIIRIEAEEKALDAAIALDKLATQSKLEAQDEEEEVFKALAPRQQDFEVEVDREKLAKNIVNKREADKAQAKERKELEEIIAKEAREERAALKLTASGSRIADNERADALPNNSELKTDKNRAELGKFNTEERDKSASEIKNIKPIMAMEGIDRQIFERECRLRELEDDLRKLAAMVGKDTKADISLKFSMKALSSLEAKVMVIILALILGFFLSGPK